jgi:hypothetical protein
MNHRNLDFFGDRGALFKTQIILPLNTPKFPVEKFVVGPSPHQKLAENSLKRFLLSEGIELVIEPPQPKDPNALAFANGDDAVKLSEIPYRQL